MYVRDVMTPDVLTVSSGAHVIDAKRMMEEHNLQRIPVVERGKLVGIITKRDLDKLSVPSPTPRDLLDFSYSIAALYKIPVGHVMHRDVVTATPDMTVEEAVALAQTKKVGALVIVEDGQVVGIMTTNDVFYKILNKILGIGERGIRLEVIGGGEGPALVDVLNCLNKSGYKYHTLVTYRVPGKAKKNVIIHLDSDEASPCVAEFKSKGFKVDIRKRGNLT